MIAPTETKRIENSETLLVYEKDYNLNTSSLLNSKDHHHTAAISCRLSFMSQLAYDIEKKEIESYNRHIQGSIDISDCSRSISLNLDGTNQEDIENSLYKINTLLEQLTICKENFLQMKNDLVSFDYLKKELGWKKRGFIDNMDRFVALIKEKE